MFWIGRAQKYKCDWRQSPGPWQPADEAARCLHPSGFGEERCSGGFLRTPLQTIPGPRLLQDTAVLWRDWRCSPVPTALGLLVQLCLCGFGGCSPWHRAGIILTALLPAGAVLALALPGVVTLGWRGCSVGALTAAETSRLCVSSYSICEWPLYLLII